MYFRAVTSFITKAGSGRNSTTRPRSWASVYGSLKSTTESATRPSRRVFRALREPSLVPTRMRSPSRSTQTGADCGEPSGMIVARWAKFGPSISFLTSSGSAMAMRASLPASELRLHSRPTASDATTPGRRDSGSGLGYHRPL